MLAIFYSQFNSNLFFLSKLLAISKNDKYDCGAEVERSTCIGGPQVKNPPCLLMCTVLSKILCKQCI